MAAKNNIIAFLKRLIKKIPVAFTKNQVYDKQTRQVIKRVCHPASNCVDVGTHKGEILDLFIKQSPGGKHFGFEPIPVLFNNLQKKYQGIKNVHLFPFALADKNDTAEFNYVVTNPAYSGLLKRRYDRPDEEDTLIKVETRILDELIPSGKKIDLIKIDVEGGEMNVLKGAEKIISTSTPVIIFEFGMGGSDIYGTTPAYLYSFFEKFGYKISLLKNYLMAKPPLTVSELEKEFNTGSNYYFIAYKP